MPHMGQAHMLRLQQEYRDIVPVATQLAQMITSELRHLVHHDGILVAVPLEFRVKTWDSIEQKFVRANFDYCRMRFSGASLSDLSDLIGVRIILLFKRDIQKVIELIPKVFQVVDVEDTATRQAIDQFGYTSVHSQIRVPNSWSAVPSFRAFRDFQVELQIRTLAQHMWASASHELQYKQEESVPDNMRRTMHRISALLELVDTEYDRLLNERDQYRSQIQDETHDRRLNTDVLEAILDSRLPRKNKHGYEPYSMLVWELGKLGITTTRHLEELIARQLPKAITKDHEFAEKPPKTRDVFFTYTGLLTIMLEQEFGVGFHSKIFEKVEAELSPTDTADA